MQGLKFDNILLYMIKCITGGIFVYILSLIFNYPDISWCLISVMLVITPDHKEAIPLAKIRIKANVIGSLAGLLCLVFGTWTITTLCLALVLTIVFCYIFKAMAGCRSALAAVIIVMLHQNQINYHMWSTALQRSLAVTAGCVIGLIITYVYHRGIGIAVLNSSVGDD
jgi:uncharacterized membrane protein YccC